MLQLCWRGSTGAHEDCITNTHKNTQAQSTDCNFHFSVLPLTLSAVGHTVVFNAIHLYLLDVVRVQHSLLILWYQYRETVFVEQRWLIVLDPSRTLLNH